MVINMKSRRILQLAILTIIAFSFFLLMAPDNVNGRILTVDDDGGAEYTRVRDAVNDAEDGDTVRVFSGTYNETVSISTSISLIGNGSEETIIDARGGYHPIYIRSDWVNISGISALNAGNSRAGIRVEGDYCNISDTNCSGNYYGIYIYTVDHSRFENNTISNNIQVGFYLYLSWYNQIENNTLEGNGFMIYGITDQWINSNISESNMVNGKPVRIYHGLSHTTITDDVGQIILIECDNLLIENYHFSSASCGIIIYKSTFITISECTFIGNYQGIYGSVATNCLFKNITFRENHVGLELSSSSHNIIEDCVSEENVNYGISIYSGRNNTLRHNTISENGINGVYIRADESIVESNTILLNGVNGIYLSDRTKNYIANNTITWNQYGIHSIASYLNHMIGNDCSNNSDYGIYLNSSSNSNIVSSNYCAFARYAGIGLNFSSGGNRIIGNDCSSNHHYGISLNRTFSRNYIEMNTISGNGDIGVINDWCSTDFINNTITDHPIGVLVIDLLERIEFHYNYVFDNHDLGLKVTEHDDETLNATWSWWGDSSGPYHDIGNHWGTGDEVSDHVEFDPWMENPSFYPTAHIHPFDPNPALVGQELILDCHGEIEEGTSILMYRWRSNHDGTIYDGPSSNFTISNLSENKHTIYLMVQDDRGYWSQEVSAKLRINRNEQQTFYVGGAGPGNYSTIQEAVDDDVVIAGDTIIVLEGTYYENVNVHKSIDLFGEGDGKTVINGSYLDSTIKVTADDVSITGFHIVSSKDKQSSCGGIRISSNGCEIHENTFDDDYYGISIHGMGEGRIHNNTFLRSQGIWMTGSNGPNTIEHNVFDTGTGTGMAVQSSSNLTISNNSFFGDGTYAVHIYNSHRFEVIWNEIFGGHAYGIDLDEVSDGCRVIANTIGETTFADIRLDDAIGLEVIGNELSGKGILYYGGEEEEWAALTIANNTLKGRPIAFYKDETGIQVPAESAQVFLGNCTEMVLEGLNCSNAGVGILIGYSSHITIQNCIIDNNSVYGLYLSYSDNNTILDSLIRSNFYYGIYFSNSNNNTVRGSNLMGNERGVYFYYYSENNVIENSMFRNNSYGVYFFTITGKNFAQRNTFIGNRKYGIYGYSRPDPLDATYCWWGNASGPYHPDDNPNGTGDNVSGYVDFSPWHGPPEALSFEVSHSAANEGTHITFTGSATGSVDITTHIFSSSLDGEFYRGPIASIPYSGLSLGTHIITYHALDEYGFSTPPLTATVDINGRPVIISAGAVPNPALLSEQIVFSTDAYDDGTIEHYVWESNIDGEIHNGTVSGFVSFSLSSGVHLISVRVMDDLDLWSIPYTFSCRVHLPPAFDSAQAYPSTATPGVPIRFTVLGASDDGAFLTYVWTSSLDGEFSNGTLPEITLSNLSIGQHAVTAYIIDDQGVASGNDTIIVIIHERPTATITSITPDSPVEGESVRFTGSGTDDGTITRYLWTSSLVGMVYNGTDTVFETTDLSVGIHIISLIVQDDHGAWSEEATSTIEIIEAEDVDDDPEFPFNKIGPLPLFAYIILLVIVIIVVVGFMKRGGKDDSNESTTTSPQHSGISMDNQQQVPQQQPGTGGINYPQQSTQQPAPQHYPQHQTPIHWSCPSCGNPVEKHYAFCLKCGAKRP